jgi:ElaB/YqjD/DUF883 family membrane-anchored ribosome-binding protein
LDATKDELKNLKKDISELQKDIKNLARAFNDDGSSRISDTRERLRQTASDIENRIKERLSDTYSDIRDIVQDRGQQAMDSGRRQIEEKPLISLAAAFLTGFVVSRLMEKK